MPSKRRSTKRPYHEPHEEFDVARVFAGGARVETGPGGEEYKVAIPRPTDKTYVCPSCSRDIPARTQHVVAWATDGLFGPEVAAAERRHWHTNCWEKYGRQSG